MNGDTGKSFLPNVWPVVMVVLLAAGVIVSKEPLESARPTDPERANVLPATQQDVAARLWQDPFAAIEKYEEHESAMREAAAPRRAGGEKASGQHKLEDVTEQINGVLAGPGSVSVTVLAISVFVDPYGESAEFRRRSRFAVLSALGQRGYFPEDDKAIGYLRVKLPESNPVKSQECIPRDPTNLTVPYEWFTAGAKPSAKVLVLWLNEDKIRNCSEIVTSLYKRLPSHNDRFTFKLVGPAGSDLLASLIQERQGRISECNGTADNPRDFEVFAPGATVKTDDLLKKVAPDRGIPEDCFGGLSIVRTTGTDDLLAAALLWELRQRGVNPCTDGIVLVHEWDTEYGRQLSRYLTTGVADLCHKTSNLGANHLREFTYLRGLDGALPGLDKKDSAAKGKNEAEKSKNLREQFEDAPPEHAEGRSQFDYLRRLADDIDRLDADKAFSANGVKAIGILGSDVYDKLLVLQALRPRFKDKIFFTTDLDARYLHADQNRWARNLVIASNFGLALHPDLQGSTAPFRDTYQTATYLATLMALDSRRDNTIEQAIDWNKKLDKWLRPQLFELGRTTAVHLASPEPTKLQSWLAGGNGDVYNYKEVVKCGGNLDDCESIEPMQQLRLPSRETVGAFGLMLLLGFGLIALTSSRLQASIRDVLAHLKLTDRPMRTRQTRFHVTVTAALAFLVLAIVIVIYWMLEQSLRSGVGEPFLWLEGISVWPGLVLRFIGLVLTIALAAYFKIRNDHDAATIAECFGLGMPEGPWRLHRRWWKAALSGPHVDLAALDGERKSDLKTGSTSVGIPTLWQNYLRATGWREMMGWLFVSVVLVLPIGYLAFQVLGRPPSFPGRGELVWYLHYGLLFASVLLLWSTIFWVGYETHACVGFIEKLSTMRVESFDQLHNCDEAATANVPDACLAPYLAFRLIVRVTGRIQGLIYLPFVLILFMVVGRSDLFDAMDFPLQLMFVIGLALAYALYSAVRLRKGADAARERLLEHYNRLLLASTAGRDSSRPVTPEQLRLIVERIRGTREGAFSRFSEQPALQALLLPFGGYGGVQLIQSLLATWNV